MANAVFVNVGTTTFGYWQTMIEQGFLNEFPGSTFIINEPNIKFQELSKGYLSVTEDLSPKFLKIKEEQIKANGKWIVWD